MMKRVLSISGAVPDCIGDRNCLALRNFRIPSRFNLRACESARAPAVSDPRQPGGGDVHSWNEDDFPRIFPKNRYN